MILEGYKMVYEWLTMSVTLNVMFFTVIYFNAKDRKERVKTNLKDVEKLLAEIKQELRK